MAKLSYIQIEQAVLSVLMYDDTALSQCKLVASDFSQQSHQVIFSAINEVASKGLVIDLISVADCIERKYRTVDMEYLGDLLTKAFGSVRNMGMYCKHIRTAARLRAARDIAMNMQHQIELSDDCEGVVEQAIQQLMAIDSEVKNYEHTIGQSAQAALDMVDLASKKNGLIGITTGLTELDESLGGFHDSDLIVIGARPAKGKTALMLNCAHSANVPVGIISAEQNHEQAGLRIISMAGEIDSKNLRTARLSRNEWDRLSGTVSGLHDREIYINDEPGIDIITLSRQARMWKLNHGIRVLFVDYIQKIRGSSSKQLAVERVTEVVTTLKDLARELNIPVVALSQVNREADKIDAPPGPSHLSDASAVEKEADTIITMFQNKALLDASQMLLHICKNRHGPTGDVTVNYLGKFFKFTDQGPRYAA